MWPTPTHFRRCIQIRGEDSPNVMLAQAQIAAGQEVTGEVLYEGVLTWDEYCHRRATWDPKRQREGLDAEWWEGADLLLFPPPWLNRAEDCWRVLQQQASNRLKRRQAKALGIDPAEGGDNTSFCVVDELGIIELLSMKTPDTTVITSMTLRLMREHGLLGNPQDVCFDRGSGKAHADRLRLQGYNVRTAAFGGAPSLEPKRSMRFFAEKVEVREDKYAYRDLRTQMYHELSLAFDPAHNPQGFALPPAIEGEQYMELRHQLSKLPKLTDEQGRYWMLPKNKPRNAAEDSDVRTLVKLIGHSPDELDAVALAWHAMHHAPAPAKAGAVR